MQDGGAIGIAAAMAIVGVAVLRYSWARPTRLAVWNVAGWSALAAAIVLGAAAAGAWGIAVASCAGVAAALVLLAKAAFERPRWRRSPRAPRASGAIEDNAGVTPWRRLGTFLIAGPLALAASVLLALALRLALVSGGAAIADANVAVLGLVPLAWPILAFALLMIERRSRQIAVLAGVSALAALPVFAGGAA